MKYDQVTIFKVGITTAAIATVVAGLVMAMVSAPMVFVYFGAGVAAVWLLGVFVLWVADLIG